MAFDLKQRLVCMDLCVFYFCTRASSFSFSAHATS
jgi:hypothetical protein